jgi:ubiquinone biosynthesis protein COQ9
VSEASGAPAFDRDVVAERVLDAALAHVPFDGWTLGVLQRGAEDAGYDRATALRVFPGGPAEAVAFWCERADRQMVATLGERDPAAMRTRDRVALAAGSLWRTVDAIWYAAGDTATDFNYYTKRALLAGVYGATLLHWLDDRSEDSTATWAFLDRRIAEALGVPRALGDIAKRVGDFFPISPLAGRS